mgnify:CR=1 FL=1
MCIRDRSQGKHTTPAGADGMRRPMGNALRLSPRAGKTAGLPRLIYAQTAAQSRHKNEPPRGEVRNVSGKSGGGEEPLTRALRSIPQPMRPHWNRFHDWRSAAAMKVIFCGARRMPLRTTRELPQQRRARGQRRIRTTRRSLSRILRFFRPYPPP